MTVNRVVALGAVGVAVLGAACGGFLALPAEMSTPRRPPAVVTAPDPNYAAYLKMLASLGPAPSPQNHASARPVRAQAAWTGRRQDSADDRWIEVTAEEEPEPPPPAMRRPAPAYDVVYYERPAPEYRRPVPDRAPTYDERPAPQYRRDLPERGDVYYAVRPWGGERFDRAPRYERYDADEPMPPPPPMPSGY